MTKDECVALAISLLDRTDVAERGTAILRGGFPDAPDEAIRAAAFHLYRDLPPALIELLADIELSLREPSRLVNEGTAWHVMYHIYNWLQLAALIPWARDDIGAEVREAIAGLENADTEFALRVLRGLARLLEGGRFPPTIEERGTDS